MDKLEQVKAICQENSKVEALVLPFDFASSPPAAWKKLASVLNELDISVLVNNAAVSHDFPVSFLDEGDNSCLIVVTRNDLDPKRTEMIMAVNTDAVMKMTAIVLPQLVSKKHGLVLNIGSMLGKLPSALLSVYSGSKAFLRHWSICTIFLSTF